MSVEIINEVQKRLSPWYSIEWKSVGLNVAVAEIGGIPMFISREDGPFSVVEAGKHGFGYISKTSTDIFPSQIAKLLNGWVRDEKGELHPPKEADKPVASLPCRWVPKPTEKQVIRENAKIDVIGLAIRMACDCFGGRAKETFSSLEFLRSASKLGFMSQEVGNGVAWLLLSDRTDVRDIGGGIWKYEGSITAYWTAGTTQRCPKSGELPKIKIDIDKQGAKSRYIVKIASDLNEVIMHGPYLPLDLYYGERAHVEMDVLTQAIALWNEKVAK